MTESAAVLECSVPELDVPMNPGVAYAALWRDYVDEVSRHHQALRALECRWAAGGDASEACTLDIPSTDDREDLLREQAKGIVHRLIRRAERYFAGPSAPLSIEDADLVDAYVPERHGGRCETFDPEAVWAALEARYGAGQGETIAYRQAAKVLIDFFRLRQGRDVETRGSRVVLSRQVYPEAWGGEKTRRVSCEERRTLHEVAGAMGTFGAWSQRPGLGAAFGALGERFWRDRVILSRERIVLAEDVEVLTTYQRFEFRLAPPLAEDLQLFVAEYGTLFRPR